MPDHIDENLQGWARVRPDLDLSAWEVTLRIGRIATHVQYQERLYEQFGLNRGGTLTLFALRRSPNYKLSPTQLGETTMATSATVTARLDKLQQQGLITRRHDTKDRRGIIVQLTPQGREVADRLVEAVVERRTRQMEMLSPKEKVDLTFLLRKVLEYFEARSSEDSEMEDEPSPEPRRRRTKARIAH